MDRDPIHGEAGPVSKKAEIDDGCVQHEIHTALFEPFVKRTDHRIVLVVDGSHNSGKRIKTGNHVSEAHQIAFELDCAMPGLKSEGSAPHVPEVRLKESRGKLVGDRSSSEKLLRFDRQALKVENILLAQTKPRRINPASISKEAGLG